MRKRIKNREPRLWSRVWLLGVVSLLFMSNGMADIRTGLIAHYPLLDGSGVSAGEDIEGHDGILRNGPIWADLGLRFDGVNQYVSAPVDTGNGPTNQITLAAWIKPEEATNWAGIVVKGINKAPYAFGLWSDRRLVFGANVFDPPGGSPWLTVHSLGNVSLDAWSHVAVSCDGARVRFYIDGRLDASYDHAVTFGSLNEPLTIGADLPGGDEYFKGTIRDVRVYNRALSVSDVAELTNSTFFEPYIGLWVGQTSLNEVKNAVTDQWEETPATFSQQVLVHVGNHGATLLKEATLMRSRDTTPGEIVVLSDPAPIPNYDGIVPRGDQLIGRRFSSSTQSLSAATVPFTRDGMWLAAAIQLPAEHALNPFRHKYHPDLAVGRGIQRSIRIQFGEGDSPLDDTIERTYLESVSGIHKDTIEARGPITFTRVSTSTRLID